MKKIPFSRSTIKICIIFVLVLIFLIPISLIKNLISDRNRYYREAVASITEPFGGGASFLGMVVAIPYIFREERFDSNGKRFSEEKIRYCVFAPDSYNLDFDVQPYSLTRGIFKVPVFGGKVFVKASFNSFDFSYFGIPESDVKIGDALLIVGFSGTKNLTSEPRLFASEKMLTRSPVNFSVKPFETSLYYSLSKIDRTSLSISGEIDFQGGEKIKITPIGADNNFSMKAAWASPSFSGGWLPSKRELNEADFFAQWNIAGLSTVYPKSWLSEATFHPESVDVSFIVPVDSYKKTERSVKYALLFLLIPFIALLVSELFSKMKIHPVQYCLIGFADVIFYLLLLSISEHIQFDVAYFLCAMCVSLATLFYATAIFKGIKWGALLSGVQLISYIFLYGTLQAEDYALLIGSIGLFVVTILLMFITRKIDWYALGQSSE